jgi:outer membrane lipoprotein-sorting protein
MNIDRHYLSRYKVLKRGISLFILLILGGSFLFAQEIITADKYLESVSEQYNAIRDMEANITIRSSGHEMTGVLTHLTPSFLRVDFSKPAEQVICFNGELLTVYLPEYRVTLSQNINQSRRSQGGGIGLTMLRRNYVPTFVSSPSPQPLDNNSRERVVKLRLTRRYVSEGFREIILSINPDTKLIRRIEGRTISDGEVRLDFTNIRTNQGIPEQRFIYDAPASANIYHNFLFRDSE